MTPSNASATARALAALDGAHVIVTGGGRGIGAAIAAEFATCGARVSIMGRNGAALQATADELSALHDADVAAFPCDVTDDQAVRDAFAAATARFGAPYALINNAGQADSATFGETSRELWDRMIAVNLTSVYLCTQQVLSAMLARGSGRIINIASTAGLRGYGHVSAYAAAKHGVMGLTRSLAVETAKRGITVNAVCPGYTDTDIAESAVHNLMRGGRTREEALAMLLRRTPRGKLTTPQEVAQSVVWLCTPAAEAITGAALPVTGGEVVW